MELDNFLDHHDYSDDRMRNNSDYDSDREYRRETSWDGDKRSRSKSPDHSRERKGGSRRYKDRDKDHHRSRGKRSRSGSRWERRSEDRKNRDRDRSYRDDDRDSVDRYDPSRETGNWFKLHYRFSTYAIIILTVSVVPTGPSLGPAVPKSLVTRASRLITPS